MGKNVDLVPNKPRVIAQNDPQYDDESNHHMGNSSGLRLEQRLWRRSDLHRPRPGRRLNWGVHCAQLDLGDSGEGVWLEGVVVPEEDVRMLGHDGDVAGAGEYELGASVVDELQPGGGMHVVGESKDHDGVSPLGVPLLEPLDEGRQTLLLLRRDGTHVGLDHEDRRQATALPVQGSKLRYQLLQVI